MNRFRKRMVGLGVVVMVVLFAPVSRSRVITALSIARRP